MSLRPNEGSQNSSGDGRIPEMKRRAGTRVYVELFNCALLSAMDIEAFAGGTCGEAATGEIVPSDGLAITFNSANACAGDGERHRGEDKVA